MKISEFTVLPKLCVSLADQDLHYAGLINMKMTCFHLLKKASDGHFYLFFEKTTSI